jgi:moderate conductance mechanosensitive channel
VRIQADTALTFWPPLGGWDELVNWPLILRSVVEVLLVLVLAWVAYHVLRLFLRRIERTLVQTDTVTPSMVQEQRVKTLLGLVRSIGVTIIVVLTLFMVLQGLGVNIGPLLAGAGVAGLAISFGAQSLVRDIISGLFILFENQFGVGDVIRVGDIGGVVERMTLRIVVLRDVHGVVHIFPNGELTRVSNMTRTFSRAVFEVGVAYREDADHVMEVMREVGRELQNDPDWAPLLTDEIKVPGIESFGESSVNIRIMATTLPLKQWEVARELRRRIKRRFDADGIQIPFPHRTFYWGEGQRPDTRGQGAGEAGGVDGQPGSGEA